MLSDGFAMAEDIVTYEKFGAKGDGKSDDLPAIIKAHDFANKNGLSVRAKDSATYYIGGTDQFAEILTNTDFGKATFIIDDRSLENHKTPVFSIPSEKKRLPLEGIQKLSKGQTHLDVKVKGPGIILVYNKKLNQYIRKGKNQNRGGIQRDAFIIDQQGKVDPKTPIIWDFSEISEMVFIPMEEKELLVRGGKFITYPPDKVLTGYHSRNISIRRSNVVIEGMRHEITKEGANGPPYSGFIKATDCANITIRDVELTGRRTYWKIGNAGQRVPMGSYDLSFTGVLNLKLENCTQTNDIMDRKYWGIMGTNFCKNLTLENCELSRFDAHKGVTNATIKNCKIGYMKIKAIGHGLFTIEDTIVIGDNFVDFRPDYGSTWNGDFVLRNCRLIARGKSVSLFTGRNTEDHDFGYVCHLPRKIEIEDFLVDDSKVKGGSDLFVFSEINKNHLNESYDPKFPVKVTEEVAIRNVRAKKGGSLNLSKNPFFFRKTKFKILE